MDNDKDKTNSEEKNTSPDNKSPLTEKKATVSASKQQSSFREERMPQYKKIIKWGWRGLIGGIAAVYLLLFILSMTDLPTFDELENPNSKIASEVFGSNGKLLGRYFDENRIDVRYEELPQHLIDALVATEDERFYEHSGIDFEALGRVLVKTVFLFDRSSGGGSTISQQLAKLLFERKSRAGMNPIRKVWVLGMTKLKEWITAVKLERSYTKEEILTMYLNKFNFIHGAYGIRSASEIYFGKTQEELTIEESALLVGMLKNPSLFNPISFPDTTLHRRMVVLSQMQKNSKITQVQYDTLRVKPLDMTGFKVMDHNEGLAPYFREYLREDLKKLLGEYTKPDGTTYNIYKDGLKIYTTIDARMQEHAEAAVRKHLSGMQKKLFKHWSKKDPWTHKENTTTKEDIARRLKALERLKKESTRYQRNRPKYLKKTIEYTFRDADVERMFRIEEDRDLIKKWESTGFIGKKLGNKYREAFKSGKWKEMKKEWETFQDAMEEEFDKPVKMTVFAYTDKNEKDTIMSPLDSIRYYRMHLQSGFLVVEPTTGHIKAWVGGVNHKYFKYDHANINVSRQIGSTFKPFLYALSVDLRGYSPCYKVIDQPITLGVGTFGLKKDWTPKNAGSYTNEPITLMEALKESKNSVSAYLMKDLGSVQPFRAFIANMGIDTARVPPVPSICLGTPDLSVFEMVGAYTAFANEGIATKPVYIQRIEDKNGNIIYESIPEQKQVLSEQATYVMLEMLKNVVGGRLGIKTPNGGKTGTTNSHADAWFMGVTPKLVSGTWVGCDDRWVRFRDIRYGQGSALARPIFGHFMKAVEADEELAFKGGYFSVPSGELEIELDCTKYINEENPEQGEDGEILTEEAQDMEEEAGGEFEFDFNDEEEEEGEGGEFDFEEEEEGI